MKPLIPILLTLFLVPARAQEAPDDKAELTAYVIDFLAPISKTRVYKQRLASALKLVPVVVTHARLQGLDPLLIAVIISYESSWDFEAVGKLGERGLMQTHGRAAKGFDMADPAQQIAAGCAHLARAMEFCKGNVAGALSRYGTGGACRPVARFVKWRLKAYRRAVKRYRKQ